MSSVLKSSLSFAVGGDGYSVVGVLMVLYALAIYPIIGFVTGRGYPRYPIFGVAPCLVTIFTFGLLLWTDKKVPRITAIVPLIWVLMGVMAIVGLQIWAVILFNQRELRHR